MLHRWSQRRLPKLLLVARWLWLVPSLCVLAAWGRSFQVCDGLNFRTGNTLWSIDTRDAARVNVTYSGWPASLDRHAKPYGGIWGTTIREGRVDYFYLPVMETTSVVQQHYFGKVYTTTLLIPFWALLLPTLPLIPMPWWRSHRAMTRVQREETGLCAQCGYDLRASPG
jgi:hypothetical protein